MARRFLEAQETPEGSPEDTPFFDFQKELLANFRKKVWNSEKKILLVDFETELQKNSQKKILRRISRNSQKELQEVYQKKNQKKSSGISEEFI